jgi:hypothetical protein
MSQQTRIVSPGPDSNSVRTTTGEILRPPADWILLPPGDAALTRRVKAAGPTWTVQEKRGRKLFSRGVWAARSVVEAIRQELEAERQTAPYARRREAEVRRRERDQAHYVASFHQQVVAFLAFDAHYAELAERLAQAVTAHATPVGSGTVARTKRISVERRAEAAVIAWLRHQTTAYDRMTIPRVKGGRRLVRRQLAQQSKALLAVYRAGKEVDPALCLLRQALAVQTPQTELEIP